MCPLPVSAFTLATGTQASGTTVGATLQAGEAAAAYGSAHSVWYFWTPATTGTFLITTNGSSYDTAIGIYTNPSGTLAAAVQVRRAWAIYPVNEPSKC